MTELLELKSPTQSVPKMETCPAEVLHQICVLLDFEDVASLHLTAKWISQIAAYHLVKQVRFHCHIDSIERLKGFADHEIYSQTVTSIVFEGLQLDDVGCHHTYLAFCEPDFYRTERPTAPSINCSERERRLYERNLAKFEENGLEKYRGYCQNLKSQQKLIGSKMYAYFVETSMSSFPNLDSIFLESTKDGPTSLSQRYKEHFPFAPFLPCSPWPEHSKTQLSYLIFPNQKPMSGLRQLEVRTLSPRFFYGNQQRRRMIVEAFRNLKIIVLEFRLEAKDACDIHKGLESCYARFAKGALSSALQGAKNLEELTINFNNIETEEKHANIRDILGESAWPNLRKLDINWMSATADSLIATLTRQPSLRVLRLKFIVLYDGIWPQVIETMRNTLNLRRFLANYVLEDPDNVHNMDWVKYDTFPEDPDGSTLSSALDRFVCGGMLNFGSSYNPLTDDLYVDEEDFLDSLELSTNEDSASLTSSDLDEI